MHTKTISLVSGGSLTLSGEFNALDLCGFDELFIEQLTDLLRDYERQSAETLNEAQGGS
jgi:hypothetical protein